MVTSSLIKTYKMRLFLTISVLFFMASAIAQPKLMDYKVWSDYKPERVGDLYIRIENANFFDNYEYASPHAVGQTLIGAWARIMGEYYFNEQLKIQVGVNGLKYTGRETFSNLSEWFSVEYRPFKKLHLLLGNIDYYSMLGLPEPMYDPTLFSIKPINRGLQFEFFDRYVDAKLWLDWEQFIVQGDNFQEIFTAGFSAEAKLTDTTSRWGITLPIHIMGRHQGGEIDSGGSSIESLMNYSLGTKFYFWIQNVRIVSNVSYLMFNDITKSHRQPFLKGSALYVKSMASYKKLRLGAFYWLSNDFFAPHGHPIYQSYTPLKPLQTFHKQKIVSLQTDFHINIGDAAKLFIEANMWYDLVNKKNNFATGLKLIIMEDFFVGKIKKRNP